jgi:fumarate hydratase class I
MQPDLTEAFIELVRRASTVLPADVEHAIQQAQSREEAGSASQSALVTILENVQLAREQSLPICQDTGTPIFEIHQPPGWSTGVLEDQIRMAVAEATARSYLRPNAVDSLTGENTGNNTGQDFPTLHFHEWDQDILRVDLLLKGGGSENVSAQYRLPDTRLKAGRDLDGVRKVVLDAVFQAQGEGCAPGVLGVAIGGDRGSSYVKAKQQLLRSLADKNPDPALAALEEQIYQDANQLSIGPMGFGGRTTLLGIKIGATHRLPASFFVSIAYMCWANRRAGLTVDAGGEVTYD